MTSQLGPKNVVYPDIPMLLGTPSFLSTLFTAFMRTSQLIQVQGDPTISSKKLFARHVFSVMYDTATCMILCVIAYSCLVHVIPVKKFNEEKINKF